MKKKFILLGILIVLIIAQVCVLCSPMQGEYVKEVYFQNRTDRYILNVDTNGTARLCVENNLNGRVYKYYFDYEYFEIDKGLYFKTSSDSFILKKQSFCIYGDYKNEHILCLFCVLTVADLIVIILMFLEVKKCNHIIPN